MVFMIFGSNILRMPFVKWGLEQMTPPIYPTPQIQTSKKGTVTGRFVVMTAKGGTTTQIRTVDRRYIG